MTGVRFSAVSFAYGDAAALREIDLEATPGELLLVAGPSGSGKSTLLRCVNGLVPHATGGRFSGDVVVRGRSIRDHPPRAMADLVGFVHQDPEAHFVVDHVEADIAFVLENLDTEPAAMRRRVEEVLDALDIAALRDRSPHTLSGGERQRCAIAAALAAGPEVLVLDEPTSQLDPQGAEDVLGAVARLNADLGTTVLIAEHRLGRAAPAADRAVLLDRGEVVAVGEPRHILVDYPGAPPVTRLGRILGWDPPPLTVKDARARARAEPRALPDPKRAPTRQDAGGGRVLEARGLRVDLGGASVLRGIDLALHEGEVVALLGRNGSGKTTVLRTLAGLLTPRAGTVDVRVRVAYVPQDPNSLLSAHTVRAEVAATLRLLGHHGPADTGAIDRWLAALRLDEVQDRHPRSLPVGARQRLAVAAVAVGGAPILLLDEPTRGMDAPSRDALAAAAADHAAGGGTVVLATHDVELAARCATRAVVLGRGDVVADGPARDVLAGSLFAPQVLRVVPPFLTVDEVAAALAAGGMGE